MTHDDSFDQDAFTAQGMLAYAQAMAKLAGTRLEDLEPPDDAFDPPEPNEEDFDDDSDPDDPGDPDYLGQMEEQRFYQLQEEDPEFLEAQARATEDRIARNVAAYEAYEAKGRETNPPGSPARKLEPEDRAEDEIARAREIIRSGMVPHLGVMNALHYGIDRVAVRAAVAREERPRIEAGIIADLTESAVDDDDRMALTERAREMANEQAAERADGVLWGSEKSMPTLHAYEAIHPHVNAPPGDQAARDFGAARACLAAGHARGEIWDAICVHGQYDRDSDGSEYARQITQKAVDENRPKPQTQPKPGGDAHTTRAPW